MLDCFMLSPTGNGFSGEFIYACVYPPRRTSLLVACCLMFVGGKLGKNPHSILMGKSFDKLINPVARIREQHLDFSTPKRLVAPWRLNF